MGEGDIYKKQQRWQQGKHGIATAIPGPTGEDAWQPNRQTVRPGCFSLGGDVVENRGQRTVALGRTVSDGQGPKGMIL
jgi:hypothetical protein